MNPLFDQIRKTAKENSFSGVFSMVQAQKELFNEAFGYADIANARKNNPATKFGIASGTKLFTALGIGRLVEQGRLSLDSTVHEIFQAKLPWIDARATVAQLLNHTSGIFDYYDEELITDFDNFFVEIPWYKLETPLDYLPLFEGKSPKFPAGERYAYSNGGYICLGMIIEKISARLYRNFIEKEVFAPAGMAASGFYAFHQLPPNTANGYKKEPDGAYQTNIYNLPIRGASDGGAYTTSGDLQKFWEALLHNKILGKELTGLFLSPQVKIRDRLDYGYGIYLSSWNDINSLFFVGGDAGVGFHSRYYPKKELLVNILSNTTEGDEDMQDILDSLPESDLWKE